MKLLFVIDSLSTGGAQRQMVTLAISLHERGHNIVFFTYAPGEKLAQPLINAKIPIIHQPKRSRFSIGVVLALRKIIKDGGFDIVLSYLATPNFYSIIARGIGSHKPVLVVSERSYDGPQRKLGIEKIVRYFYLLSKKVVLNSHHQRESFSTKYPWLKTHLTTIYNGVDLQTFVPPTEEPPASPFKLLVIGSVAPFKNGLCLIEALDILRSQYDLKPIVNWVGEHVHTIKDRCEYLILMKQKISEKRLNNQWNWLYQQTDITHLLQNHHALVHPSFGEGLPNVVCEALACGRPIILSNTLDHPRLIQDGVSGYLFDWKNPHSLAKMIYTLYSMPPQKRKFMGQQGRYFAEKHLSISHLTDEYERIFKELI